MCMEGQHGGNGVLLNPLGIVNDGLSELIFIRGRPGISGMMKFMDDATKGGGVHCYDKSFSFMRGQSFKVVPKRDTTGQPHVYAIDGEVLYFSKFIKYDTVPGAIEVLVDFDILME